MMMDSSDIFCSQVKYFQNALHFFDEYQWLIKYPVTEILTKNLLYSIPNDWLHILRQLNYHELNEFATGKLVMSDWPSTLLLFLKQCKEINKLSTSSRSTSSLLPPCLCHGLTLKKQHEVSHLVDFIHEKCKAENIQTIVDFGSGLGYICQALNYLYGYRVFGLESNHEIYNNACKRQLKLFPESCNNVKYLYRKVDFEDIDDIKFIESILLPTERVCFIGLHSCGDLGLTSALAFQRIRQSKLLIMISCCYHKLQVSENNEIMRFGMSRSFQKAMTNYNNEIKLELQSNEKVDVRNIFNRPFMRLACQEPATRWEEMSDYDHQQHALCVLSRAVIELYAFENNIILKKCVNKATRKTQCINFYAYLLDTMQRYTFNGENVSNNKDVINEILRIWENHKEKLHDVEIFTALQLLLQAPAESIVLEDRRFSLIESSAYSNINITAEIIPVFDAKISPRCQAMVARIEE